MNGDLSLPTGTVTATFDDNGRYGNHTDGSSHAAIHMGQNGMGIQVLDQWNGRHGSHPVNERTIIFKGHEEKADDGDRFSVVG